MSENVWRYHAVHLRTAVRRVARPGEAGIHVRGDLLQHLVMSRKIVDRICMSRHRIYLVVEPAGILVKTEQVTRYARC